MSKAFNSIYSVSWFYPGFIVQKNKPGTTKTFYLKSIYDGKANWYTDPLYGKTYKTEKAAYKTIQKIINQEDNEK